MRKSLCFVICLAMFAIGAHAAEGITADEQKILDSLHTGVVVNGTQVNVSTEYINQAENFLKINDVDASKVDAIIAEIDAVKDIMVSNGITNVKDIKGSAANQIFERAQNAACIVDVTLTLNADKTITVKGKDGKVIFTANKGVIKDTGDNYGVMFLMSSAFALVLVGAGTIANKKGYFAK